MENVFAVFSLSGWNDREGSPDRDLTTESSHEIEKGRNPFASTEVGKRMNHNCRYKVLFTNDL